MISKISSLYNNLPNKFWTLALGMFVDRLGGALIFPFFALYITQHFNVGMTEVGILFAFFSVSSLIGQTIGGALTDKYGRKKLIIFSLIMSASSTVLMGLVDDLRTFYFLAILVGILADTGGPAYMAMISDLLPENKRSEGFAVLRVTANLAVTIGPLIGGLLAGVNYLLLFIIDAIMSTITAGIILFKLPETMPAKAEESASGTSLGKTIIGYIVVFKDRLYMVFILVSIISVIVYLQMNSTLSVYLLKVHSIPPKGFGYILSLNAAMVVVFQYWISRGLKKVPPLVIMMLGNLLYAIGFGLYGFISAYWMMLVAMAIITIGEMFTVPVAQTIVSYFAPEEMRGRYMAIFGYAWILPSAIGPLLAGLIMDNTNPNWVWYGSFILALLSALGYWGIHLKAGHRFSPTGRLSQTMVDPAIPSVES
jgi:MFS family permease